MSAYVLEMKQIKKAFNHVEVLKGIDFSLKKGEIHALLGENGAGKSTLMNILGGVLQADEGELILQGQATKLQNPRMAKEHGISFIHQELNIVSDLLIYENMFLGAELVDRFGFLQVEAMCAKSSEVLQRMGIHLNPKAYVRDIEASYKQIIEIARALLEDAKIIIMDEPTSSLAQHEVGKLFTLMRSLKESGVTIIYISHKLKEVLEICDNYTVLRDGVLAGSGRITDTDEEQLTRLMVGKTMAGIEYYERRQLGAPVLSLKNFSVNKLFRDINVTAHEGEILGFTGLAGDGRTELFEAVFGYRRGATGEIQVKGKTVQLQHPREALEAGIGLVPKNRKENAIIKDMSVLQNMSLTALSHFERGWLIQDQREKETFEAYRQQLNIKVADPDIPIISLSGGNQQKVVMAKWLEVHTSVLIFDNPTQGIDVGAKSEIYHLIMKLAKQGKAIIILTSEIPEILKLCDRIHVMYQGEITATFDREQADEEEIMLYATGAKRGENNHE